MTTKTKITLAVLAAIASGILLGQTVPEPVVDPSAAFRGLATVDGYEWRMFGGNVAGTGGSGEGFTGHGVFGPTLLYNAKTGKVYRIYDQCGGENGTNGCMWALPVFSADRLGDYLPNPLGNDPL